MSELNYKTKYQALKLKFMDAIDVAFRLGYEAGAQQSQMQAATDQAAQAQQQAQMQDAAPGQQGKPSGPPGGLASEPPDGEEQSQPQQEPQEDPNASSELDQHIGQLESMVSKGDFSPADLMKALSDLKDLKAKPKKSSAPFKLSHSATHNMSDQQKHALNMQQEIVAKAMGDWNAETDRAKNDVRNILAREGLLKSED
jgi:hypothetical protein